MPQLQRQPRLAGESRFNERIRRPLTRLPRHEDRLWILIALPYGIVSIIIGINSGILHPSLPQLWELFLLPPILLVFPSIIEESIFRGLLLPPSLDDASVRRRTFAVIASTALFVAMHPLNHWLIGLSDTSLFTNPTFLVIVTLLGLTCAIQYLKTRSLWVPIATHWLTVVVWNLFLGRDLNL